MPMRGSDFGEPGTPERRNITAAPQPQLATSGHGMPMGMPATQAAKPASNFFATGAAPPPQGRPRPAATHPDGGSVSPARLIERVGCPLPTAVLSNGCGAAGGSGQGPAAERKEEDAAVRARKEAAAEKAAAAKLAANAAATASRERMLMSISGPGASLLGPGASSGGGLVGGPGTQQQQPKGRIAAVGSENSLPGLGRGTAPQR